MTKECLLFNATKLINQMTTEAREYGVKDGSIYTIIRDGAQACLNNLDEEKFSYSDCLLILRTFTEVSSDYKLRFYEYKCDPGDTFDHADLVVQTFLSDLSDLLEEHEGLIKKKAEKEVCAWIGEPLSKACE